MCPAPSASNTSKQNTSLSNASSLGWNHSYLLPNQPHVGGYFNYTSPRFRFPHYEGISHELPGKLQQGPSIHFSTNPSFHSNEALNPSDCRFTVGVCWDKVSEYKSNLKQWAQRSCTVQTHPKVCKLVWQHLATLSFNQHTLRGHKPLQDSSHCRVASNGS